MCHTIATHKLSPQSGSNSGIRATFVAHMLRDIQGVSHKASDKGWARNGKGGLRQRGCNICFCLAATRHGDRSRGGRRFPNIPQAVERRARESGARARGIGGQQKEGREVYKNTRDAARSVPAMMPPAEPSRCDAFHENKSMCGANADGPRISSTRRPAANGTSLLPTVACSRARMVSMAPMGGQPATRTERAQ